jgi:hypothetical protein
MNTLNALVSAFIMSAPPVYLPPGVVQYQQQALPGAYPAAPVYTRPPPARVLSQQQWKQQIVDAAQRFCNAYPGDPICHFQDPR